MALNCRNCKAYCCRRIGLLNPDLDRGDLVCKHLNKDNKCDIYDNRPLICNTDRLYEALYKDIMTKDEWVKINQDACRKLKDESSKEANKEKEESDPRPED
jgi:hypothetical protein